MKGTWCDEVAGALLYGNLAWGQGRELFQVPAVALPAHLYKDDIGSRLLNSIFENCRTSKLKRESHEVRF